MWSNYHPFFKASLIVCSFLVGEGCWVWDRLIRKWVLGRYRLGFCRWSFATCSICWALEAYFVGQGFPCVFWRKWRVEVHQRPWSIRIWRRPHCYQARCLSVIRSLIFISFYLFHSILLFHSMSVFSYLLFSRYIHRELVVKNAFPRSSLPIFLEDWVDTRYSHCVYTVLQITKFPHPHLLAGGWYLDCSRGFVPEAEESLYGSLVSSGTEVLELEEEPEEDHNPPPAIVKEIGSAKGKGKGKRVASSQVSTRSNSKASVQRQAAPATTVVGSPSAIPQDLVPAPSHSGFTVPSVPRKRKAIAPDTSGSSLEKSSSHVLIENVDMGELIEDLMRTKVHPPPYRRIQEFLTKVSLPFISFPIQSICFIILFWFLSFFASQVGGGRTRPNTKPKVHIGIDLIFADVPENLRVPNLSNSHLEVPKWNIRSPTYFEVLFAFAGSNLHDDGVLVFAHAADPEVSRSIHNWAHTEDFYVAEDWFGMNDLDLQSPTSPTELVIPFHPYIFFIFFSCVSQFLILSFGFLPDSQVLYQGARS